MRFALNDCVGDRSFLGLSKSLWLLLFFGSCDGLEKSCSWDGVGKKKWEVGKS